MCWNEQVSMNTFLYSTFVLLLIIYNNTYTQYKLTNINTVWDYLFIMSFILMQLFEFFIWRNLKNPFYNRIFSTFAGGLLLLQPAFSIMMITKETVRNSMVLLYSLLMLPYVVSQVMTGDMKSVKGKCGHLQWHFLVNDLSALMIWFFFFLFGAVYEKRVLWLLFCLGTLLLSYLNYNNNTTHWSMWCWITNAIMTFFAVKLLFWLPYLEKGSIC
jgi:hypothetical protein